jgi:hypothetical protein
MTRRALTSTFTAAALTLALPLFAQDKGSQGARPNPSGTSSGSAVPSGSGGGSSGGGSSSGAGSSSSPSGGGSSVSRPGGGSSGGSEGYRAPSRPERRGEDRAAPRSASGGDQRRVAPAGSSSATGSNESSDRRRAVPAYSRPRDGRTPIGTAVPRVGPVPNRAGGGFYGSYYDPFYRYSSYYNRYPYGYYWPGYGFGVGYFYDPWMWGYSSYGYGGYHDPYAGYGGGYSRSRYRDVGSLRLKVKPEHGQVYVDGYYVGEVDAFDGAFQRLAIESGAHRIEIRADGYETAQFEVMVIPGETVTYKGDLKRR